MINDEIYILDKKLKALQQEFQRKCEQLSKTETRLWDIEKEANFLCDRLDEYNPDDGAGEFYGHVSPSHSRLKLILAK